MTNDEHAICNPAGSCCPPKVNDDARTGRSEGVWIDPARLSGEACLTGTRIPVHMVGEMAWDSGVQAAMDTWDLNRRQVLVACWFLGVYGIGVIHRQASDGPRYRRRFADPWRTRWREWAEGAADALWSVNNPDELLALADPPTDGEAA